MADKKISMQYRYTIEMYYLDTINEKNVEIKNECLKMLVIDHNFMQNCMPVIMASLKLDKALVDDMIKNCNDNMIMLAINKYDDLTDDKQEVECIRKKFTYFLPKSANKNDPIDYNEVTEEENLGNTYTEVQIGLLCIDHINNNKHACEIMAKNNTIYDCVKYVTSHISRMIIEPFSYNSEFEQLIMPTKDSVKQALQFLNDFRVFYYTPYRYYNDFNYTYIISSSGRATEKQDELYSSIIIDIKDIDDASANDVGVIANKTSETYEVPVNYVNTEVYDNTIVNKSKTKLKGISSTGSDTKTLVNRASYMDEKTQSIRLNNDNTNMISNLEAVDNDGNFLVFISKNDLDMELFTINKRISIHNIERYQDYNGDYLLSRKRECFVREDNTFVLTTMLNLRRIERADTVNKTTSTLG